jgi:hypothetical protein
MHSLNTFGARTSQGQTWTHKTHHGPDLGEATTFPLIIYFVLNHRTNTQMSFCHFPKIGTPATLGAHNFMCRPSIKVKS